MLDISVVIFMNVQTSTIFKLKLNQTLLHDFEIQSEVFKHSAETFN
jgi:hypothetical protein